MRPPSRRAVLLGVPLAVAGMAGVAGGAYAGVETGVLPGKRRLTQALEGCGPAAAPPAGIRPGPVRRITWASRARRRTVRMVVALPPGPSSPNARLPVCLVLHGLGGDAEQAIVAMGLDRYLAASVAAGSGVRPFALAALDGGTAYWHRRASGDDPEAMILSEALPRLAGLGLRTDRVGVLGWSMGGYGALLLGRRHPSLVAAVAASSPAVWRSYGDSAPGAFDSPADFAAHRVLGAGPAPGVAYRIDCGHADAFYEVSRTLVGQLRPAEHHYGTGCHDANYWRRAVPGQLRFVGRALGAGA